MRRILLGFRELAGHRYTSSVREGKLAVSDDTVIVYLALGFYCCVHTFLFQFCDYLSALSHRVAASNLHFTFTCAITSYVVFLCIHLDHMMASKHRFLEFNVIQISRQ